MLFVLFRAVEPAVVRDVDQEIDILITGPHILPGERRVGVLVADQAAEVVGLAADLQREPGLSLPRPATVLGVVGCKMFEKWKRLGEWNVLAERNQVDLVVAGYGYDFGIYKKPGVVASQAVLVL